MGGKPSKATPADKRLKENRPPKPAAGPKPSPFPGAKAPFAPKKG